MNIQMKKGILELCIFELLEKKDWYGYEIIGYLRETLDVKDGTVYPLLQRLEREGDIVSYTVPVENQAKIRKYYQLSGTGSGRLEELRKDFEQIQAVIDQCHYYNEADEN